MDHPSITRTLRTGYPTPEPIGRGEDIFGNEVVAGDEILIINTKGDFIATEDLTQYEIKLWLDNGAEESTA